MANVPRPAVRLAAMLAIAPRKLPSVALRLYDGRLPDPPVRDYHTAVIDGALDVRAGAAAAAAATVTAESTTWSDVLFGALPIARAERAGTVRIEGDRDAAVRLVDLYS